MEPVPPEREQASPYFHYDILANPLILRCHVNSTVSRLTPKGFSVTLNERGKAMMIELDKEKFGAFVAQLRKEKNLTQKELAERLFLSDKAVSKWERGMSLPDISLLEPLAELLGVNVTELLRGERLEAESLDRREVEHLVTAVAHLSEEEKDRRKQEKRRWQTVWCFSAAGSGLGVGLLRRMGVGWEEIGCGVFTVELLCLIFGAWACFLAKDVLPRYYDENAISFYSQGCFRMNLPGVRFNNRNWPHILRVMCWWMIVTPVVFPLLYALLRAVVPHSWGQLWALFPTLAASLGFMVPMTVVGRRNM